MSYSNARHIILVPGIGDRIHAYALVKLWWRLCGHKASVFVFGWDAPASNFDESMDHLNRYISAQADNVTLVGVSAGGTSVLQAGLQQPDHIEAIITICSPLTSPAASKNDLVRASIAHLETRLQHVTTSQLVNVLSIYGLYDERVAIRRSKIDGIRQLQLPTVLHGLTIFVALIVCSISLYHLLQPGHSRVP